MIILQSEAWIFFVGSSGSFIITVVSLKVLYVPSRASLPSSLIHCGTCAPDSSSWLFPRFIELLRKQGADPHTIVRLSTYSQLNVCTLHLFWTEARRLISLSFVRVFFRCD